MGARGRVTRSRDHVPIATNDSKVSINLQSGKSFNLGASDGKVGAFAPSFQVYIDHSKGRCKERVSSQWYKAYSMDVTLTNYKVSELESLSEGVPYQDGGPVRIDNLIKSGD